MIQLHDDVLIAVLQPGDDAGFACVETMLRLLHAETPHAAYDAEKVRESIHEVVNAPENTGYCFVSLTKAGEVAGTASIIKREPWFSRDAWLDNPWFFVHPAHRRTPHAKCLLRALVMTAKGLGMPLHVEVNSDGVRTAGKARLFARELGEPSGVIFTVRP